MNYIIQYFLPNSKFTYEQDPNRPLTFTHVRLRPFTSSFFIKGKEISFHINQTTPIIVAKRLTLFTKHKTKIEAFGISYTIHKKIQIAKLVVTIGDFTCRFEHVTLYVSPVLSFKIQSIHFGNHITIQRFDKYIPIQITIQNNQLFHIFIPEIRIYSTPSYRMIQSWKESIMKWVPQEEGDAPLPEIHLSSIFIRHVPTNWKRCISPISIGNNYKNVWEIWEHVMRAVTRI